MSLFKKKTEEKENPYYSKSGMKKEELAAKQPATPAAQMPAKPIAPEQPKEFSIPLIPTPPPIVPQRMDLEPISSAGMSVMDALRLETNPKSIAYIKLSDFKKVLEDIKNLEKRLIESQSDLDKASRILDSQKEYIRNYNNVVQDIRKMVDKLSVYLSNVEE